MADPSHPTTPDPERARAAGSAPFGIEPERSYTPNQVAETGLVPAETLSVWRYRTRKTGKQHGPRWAELSAGGGRPRIVYPGRELLRFLAGPAADQGVA